MHRFARDNGLSLFFLVLFLAALASQSLVGLANNNEELGTGVAVYLAATAAFWLRMARRGLFLRISSALLIAAAIPLWAALPGLWSLAGVLGLMCILLVLESVRPSAAGFVSEHRPDSERQSPDATDR
jgi:hypothetical protein